MCHLPPHTKFLVRFLIEELLILSANFNYVHTYGQKIISSSFQIKQYTSLKFTLYGLKYRYVLSTDLKV